MIPDKDITSWLKKNISREDLIASSRVLLRNHPIRPSLKKAINSNPIRKARLYRRQDGKYRLSVPIDQMGARICFFLSAKSLHSTGLKPLKKGSWRVIDQFNIEIPLDTSGLNPPKDDKITVKFI